MKRILTLVLCWLIAFSAMAETTFKAKTAASVAGGYVTSMNKVNGSFEDGAASWSASIGTIVPTASTEFQGNYKGVWSGTGAGTLDLQWTATASNTYEASAQVNVLGKNNVYVCAYVGTTETGCKLIPALNKIQKVSVVADSVISSAFYLRLKHTGSDAFSIDVDDGKIEPWTPQAVNLEIKEAIRYTGYTSGTTGGVKFKTLAQDSGSALIEDDNSGSYTKFKFLKPCYFTAQSILYVNSGTLSSYNMTWYNSSGNPILGQDGQDVWGAKESTIVGYASVGDYIYVTSGSGLSDNNNTSFSITATAISDNVVQSWQDGMASWSATSTIQIGATTTAPTKGTTDLDQVKWIKRGESAEFWYQYSQTGVGSAGSGDYLFSLPNGMQFADHVIKYTTLEGTGGWATGKVGIAAGTGWNGGSANYTMFIFPYDSTRFRVAYIGASDASQTGSGVVGSAAAFNMAGVPHSYSLKFTAPIKGFSNTPPLYALPTRSEVFSANISASGAVSNATQNFVTSCTNAAPSVCSLWSNFGVAPICESHTVDITKRAEVTASTATTTTVARTDTSTAFNLFCHLK